MTNNPKGSKQEKPPAAEENEFVSAMNVSDDMDQRERMKRWEELQKSQELLFASSRQLIGRDAQLLPTVEASIRRFWEMASQFTVLHLSCHGYLDTLMPTALLASHLEFKGESMSAKQVFEHQGQLTADLVFLNACRSGLFNTRRGNEIGGFWGGFLNAGAASIIATLRFVDPDSAHRLALKFYNAWTKEGVTKAEALRRAQLAMCQAGAELRYWASHVLVGAHR
jgi:CHAT domain-containing protein